MLLTHFIWQTVLKPLSGTNAKNGAITPSLTPTMHTIHARCYKASEMGVGGGGGTNRQGNKCVCVQGVCGGFGTRRPSNQEAFCKGLEGAAQCFIILMIRSPVQDVCTLVRLNFVE
jgi:hypothetical protein